jgi:hypothetical protein
VVEVRDLKGEMMMMMDDTLFIDKVMDCEIPL